MAAPAWLTARPIAHRGFHDGARLIENTLPAAEAAIAKNFAIECDLQLTADGRVVVFHDDRLDRLTNASGDISRMSFRDVRAARFRSGDAGIPALEDLLDLVDGRVPVVAEVKSRWTRDRRLESATAELFLGYEGPAAVMSFDPASMIAMRRHAPGIPRGMTADSFTAPEWPNLTPARRLINRWLLAAPFVMPSFIAYDVDALPASAPLALRHFFGVPLLTWTVRDVEQRKIARAWADQIIFEGFNPDTG